MSDFNQLPPEVSTKPLEEILTDINSVGVSQLDLRAGDSSFLADLMSKAGTDKLSPKQEFWLRALYAKALGLVSDEPIGIPKVAGMNNLLTFMRSRRSKDVPWPHLHLKTANGRRVDVSLTGAAAAAPNTLNVTDNGKYPNNKWYGRINDSATFVPNTKYPESEIEDVIGLLVQLKEFPANTLIDQGTHNGFCPLCGKSVPDSFWAHSTCIYSWKLLNVV